MPMNRYRPALAAALLTSLSLAATAACGSEIPDLIAAAVADANRPDADKQRDENRKPAETLIFAGVRPGEKIAELVPGGGYFTRIFSKVVGGTGHVYALVPAPSPTAPAGMPGLDMVVFNQMVFAALKPGGTYLVLDHVAQAGSGARDVGTLHRIDPQLVKKEVLAAGFVFVGRSDLLHRSDDPHTAKVFDPAIRGKTDQFILKFRKPLARADAGKNP